MLSIAYTMNESLKQRLALLEDLRKDLHVMPLSRDELYERQWQALLSRIRGAMLKSGIALTENDINKIVNEKETFSLHTKRVRDYKRAYDYVRRDWYVSQEKVTPQTISTIDAILTGNTKSTLPRRVSIESLYELKQLFSYLQSGNEHPVIQAGIVYIEVLNKYSSPIDSYNLENILTYVTLYKYGWHFLELISLEEAWVESSPDYAHALKVTKETNNSTVWLEYFVNVLIRKINQQLPASRSARSQTDKKAVLRLSGRHREIMLLFDDPQTQLTNKNIQEYFKVTQITASRDLARLTLAGLLYSHKKGRSTFYTKA